MHKAGKLFDLFYISRKGKSVDADLELALLNDFAVFKRDVFAFGLKNRKDWT